MSLDERVCEEKNKSVNGQIPARAEFGRVVSNWKCKNLRPSIKLNQGRIVSSRD